jgi:hypothetical protein
VGYKLWGFEELAASADVNAYLMKQTIVVCTSGTRPSSPPEGMHIYETDTDRLMKWNGSAWESVASSRIPYTPTLTADTNPTLGSGALRLGWYAYMPGPSIAYSYFIKFGTSGTNAGNGPYKISLPVNSGAVLAGGHGSVGSALLADVSLSVFKSVAVLGTDNSAVFGMVGDNPVNHTFPWAWAANDYLSGTIVYPI